MLDIKHFSQSKDLVFKVGGVLFVYLWSFYSRSTYTAFFMGMFSTIFAEAFLIWQYLGSKILKESGKKISIELATLELRRIFGFEAGVNYHDVQRKIKKKNYYQNSKSKPLVVLGEHTTRAQNSNHNPSFEVGRKGSFFQSFENVLEERPTFSHKPINELLKLKEHSGDKEKIKRNDSPSKTNLEERTAIIKVGYKNFNGQMTEYLKILECITTSEKLYGKAMHSFNEKLEGGLFSSAEDNLLEKEDQEIAICEIEDLSQDDMTFLSKKFGEHIKRKAALILPHWTVLKATLSYIGKIHYNCSAFVSQVSVATIDMMSVEYNEKYKEVKEEKKKIAKDYEEAYLAYFKMKNEYETVFKSLETALVDYQAKYKKKESDEVVLRYEMKARLLKSQLDSVKNKLSGATSSLKDMVRTVNGENEKLRLFIQEWNLRQGSVCQNVLRSVISILEESSVDCERSFEKLFENIEDLYCSFQNLDDIDDGNHNLSIDEKNDANSRIHQKMSLTERRSPPRPVGGSMESKDPELRFSLRELRLSHQTVDPKKITGPELETMFKEFKSLLKECNQVYEKETQRYTEEVKKSKEVMNVLSHLCEFADEYVKEKTKLVSFGSLNLDNPNVNMYWTIVQENLKLVVGFNIQLHEKLANIDKVYCENVRAFRREFKNSEIIVNNAVKRATNFVKVLEREVAAKSFTQLVKQWFNRSDDSEGPVSTINKLFGPESIARIYNRDEDLIGCEREYLKNDFKIGLTQIKNATKSFQKESNNLKKDLILAYLQCYSSQKELLFALVKELDKINHFTENIETHLQEIYGQIDDEDDHEQEEQERQERQAFERDQFYKRFSLITPIKVDRVPEIDLDTAKYKENGEEESPTSVHEVHTQGEDLVWINKMLGVFSLEWSKSGYFREKMMKSLYTAFNKKKAGLIRQIKVVDFMFGDKAPVVKGITCLPSDRIEFLCDFELGYQGNFGFEIQVQFESQPFLNMLNKDKPLWIDARINLKSLAGKLRICWVPSEYGTSWFSFVGEPSLDLKIEPKVGLSKLDLSGIPQVISILKDFLESKIRKMTYPYRKELDLPMAFRTVKVLPLAEDDDYK